MSLDVWLYESQKRKCECGKSEITEDVEVFEANITHNLNKMAAAVDIYHALWSPEDIGAIYANDIISSLENGLKLLKEHPEAYKQFNPKNGWGSYKDFVPWIESYLNACKEYPESIITINK